MATPGMSWQQHYYGGAAAKFVPSPAAGQQAGHGMDYSQDLHLKMSKKIAQLTKVWARPRVGKAETRCAQRGAHLPAWEAARPAPGASCKGAVLETTARDLAPRTVQTSVQCR